ncbi:helix-turn-helix transcriptional regulator [Algoriphagus antarcticus]|uniref:Plasmid maintenance system antidote protein VapI n=1 Tax=Algoriphagus antarcticus TaxID=238540 RepID=A0A3E0D6E2_9BACT|nr:hypothetical protein [Algoriphagus antarcticus]REG78226.1 plasmid maintenance system antidote protein VapI [Algoriphagus antarcticus]
MKNNEFDEYDVKIGLETLKDWNEEALKESDSRAKENALKRSPATQIKIQLAGLQYRIEENLENSDSIIDMEEIVKELNGILNITKSKLAQSIDMDSPNLSKYLKGDRKLNSNLAMKLGSFFHINPEIWLEIVMKNELIKLKSEQDNLEKYKKYDYEKVISY